ncbi:MAG: DNA-directed RNA polymerase subunit omega [Candidatus Midichloria sp.]|nr:DNA-directed RNA polymerase subunit omega [Candidatus Midichloria sp.]
MARITIEDCLTKVEDRFALVVLAAQRARDLAFGATPLVPKNNDKYAVIALREIADSALDTKSLQEAIIKRNQRKQLLQVEDQYETVDEETESAYQQAMANFAVPSRKKLSSNDDEDVDDEIGD